MIAHNDLLCRQAKSYYYDFLYSESCEPIPEYITTHIENCQRCQKQVNQLKEVLTQANAFESQQKQYDSAAIEMLKLHFAYMGGEVTCNVVKPFLPGLLDPALEIRIPTPITTHLDNCRQCSEDLEIIRGLNLNHKQLRRLSQLFAEKPAKDSINCSQARAAILAVVTMAFRKTNAETLKHLCVCHDCRKLLYQYRETVQKELLHNKMTRKEFPCEKVSAADVFDYAVPYGIDPANDQYAKFRKSFTSHAATCPDCLAKMQQLHNTVYAISERAESEVVTIYHIDESAKAEVFAESDNLYAGFPIKVDVINREDEVITKQSASTFDFTTALKRKVSAMNLKPLLKTAVAAAAVILIGVALLLNTPTAGAVTIDKIYKAIEKVKNIYISSFVPDKKEPIQEKWVSRTLNIYMTKTGKELVLWDISNGVRKNKHLDTAIIETTPLEDNMVVRVERKMSGSLGLMPFYDLSVVPEDAEWSRVIDDGLEAITKGVEVYDLTWVEKKYGGSVIFWKWRVFAEAETNLPRRVEWYKKFAANDEFELRTVMVVECLSDGEIQAVIREASL